MLSFQYVNYLSRMQHIQVHHVHQKQHNMLLSHSHQSLSLKHFDKNPPYSIFTQYQRLLLCWTFLLKTREFQFRMQYLASNWKPRSQITFYKPHMTPMHLSSYSLRQQYYSHIQSQNVNQLLYLHLLWIRYPFLPSFQILVSFHH